MYRLLAVFALVSCAVADTILVPDNIDGRIVDGVDTTIEEHPYQVSVQTISGSHFCGGSIISEDIVVTAAHCLVRYKPEKFRVRLGSTSHNEGGLVVDVKDIRIHKKYRSITKDYDVAVIKLVTPVHQSTKVRYIKLAQSAPPTGTFAVVTGWGIKSIYSNKPSKILQKVEVEIIDREICASNRFKHGRRIKSSMFCAHAVGKDACTGDSGGPLVVRNELVGIISWGTRCGLKDYPGVYCNVTEVREWIEKTAQEL